MNASTFEKNNVLQSIHETDKLSFYNSTRQWHTKFNYQLIDMEELKSVHLEDNRKFQVIKESIQSFNRELQSALKNNQIVSNYPTKYNFYQNIAQLLREAIIVKGYESQQNFLDKIYLWFTNNRKDTRYTEREVNRSSDARIIKDQTNRIPMPSEYIEDQLCDYKKKARTMHFSCDPPPISLQKYKRRQFNQITSIIPQIIQKQTFPKMIPHQEIQQQQENEQTEQESEINIDPELLVNNEEEDDKKKKAEINMIPKVKAYLQDDLVLEYKDLNKDFENRQNYQVYQSSQQDAEMSLQNRWINFRQKEAQDKKVDEEIVNSMNYWSKNKARIEKEIDRRVDSQYYGSRYSQIDQKPQFKPQKILDQKLVNLKPLPTIIQSINQNQEQLDVSGLETKVSDMKVTNTLRAYKDILNLSATEIQQEDRPQSLSIYAKLRSNSVHNKFSSLLKRNSPARINEQSLQEVIDIKNRLAKYKIPIPMNSLMSGIMLPTFEEYNQKLTEIGQQMLVNPFEEKKGKKKKKKKSD